MRNWSMAIMVVILTAGSALATTLNLNDGRSVEGSIVKNDSKSVQISVDGVSMTYYADEIKDIDGKPFGAAIAPAPAVPSQEASLPAVQPQAVAAAPAPVVQPVAVTAAPAAQPATEAAPAATSEAIAPEKKELILKFMDVFGTRRALNDNFKAMLTQIAKEKPDEAKTIGQRVKIDEIINRLLPIYDRHFSSDDLKAFIAFYESDEGQKLIKTIPLLMKESVQESIKYMQEKFPEVKNEGQQ